MGICQAENKRIDELHRRFAFGVLLGMAPEELRPFVTGLEADDRRVRGRTR